MTHAPKLAIVDEIAGGAVRQQRAKGESSPSARRLLTISEWTFTTSAEPLLVVWARGHVTFARLTPMGGYHPDGQPRLWCSAGVQIDVAAPSERRMVRDLVIETARARDVRENVACSCC